MPVTIHLLEVQNPVFSVFKLLYSMCGGVRHTALKQPSVLLTLHN